MNCDLACRLMDDYLENRLSLRDRQRIDEHLGRCVRCRQEMKGRLAFEDHLRFQLAASVSHLHLPAQAGRRIVQAAQQSAQRAFWSNRLIVVSQVVLGAVAVLVLLVGLVYSLGQVPAPPKQATIEVAAPEQVGLPVQEDSILIEPAQLQVGAPFTVTLGLRNTSSQPLADGLVVFSLERVGASRPGYRFAIPLGGEVLPGERWKVRLTPQALRRVCLAHYRLEPAGLLAEPGVYAFRVSFEPASP